MSKTTWKFRPTALCTAIICILLSGCGLLGIDVFRQPTVSNVQFYTAPIICESDNAGELVQTTWLILHNPEADPVDIYRRGVMVGLETDPLPEAVVWSLQELEPDQAVRLDCDSFARILTNDPAATFDSEFGPGTRVDGFLTIGIEAGSEAPRLDASVQYNQPGGFFTIDPVIPPLVVVEAWPPNVDNDDN